METRSESGSVHGPPDAHMVESVAIPAPSTRRSVDDAESRAAGAGTSRPRSRSATPPRRTTSAVAAASWIQTRATTMKCRSPTPPRSRITLEGEAAETLQRTEATAQSAAGFADAAMQEARKAMMETASVRKAVEDTLSLHLQASTSLSGQQIAQLARETSAEF